jgi:hypothetical protein
MRHLLKTRPSPAMVVACLALVIALGGTGYAAIKLPRNSVGNKQLRSNAVTSGKVRNGSLAAKDFQSSALKRGPRGPHGPKGDSAPGAIPRVAFASRDMYAAPGPGATTLTTTPIDLIGLGVAAGTSNYTASSGQVVVNGASRLVANGQAVLLNAAATRGDVGCRLVLVGSDTKVLGNYVNAFVEASNGYLPVAVSAGTDVDSGTYDVRLQCFSGSPTIQFHRGNLTVAVAPR